MPNDVHVSHISPTSTPNKVIQDEPNDTLHIYQTEKHGIYILQLVVETVHYNSQYVSESKLVYMETSNWYSLLW